MALTAFRPEAASRRSWRQVLTDDGAGALVTMDFVLVFPIMVTTVLVVAQLLLIFHAHLVVRYAVFAASRSVHVFAESGKDTATERARRAAAVALMPISPSFPGLTATRWTELAGTALVLAHGSETSQIDGSEFWRRWLKARAGYAYARTFTDVQLLGFDSRGSVRAGQPVTTEVRYPYLLRVPYADAVLGLALRGNPISTGWVLTLSGAITQPNDGRVRLDWPPTPERCTEYSLQNLLDALI